MKLRIKSVLLITLIVTMSFLVLARGPEELVKAKGEPDEIVELEKDHIRYDYVNHLDKINALSRESYFFYKGEEYRVSNILVTESKLSLQIAFETAVDKFSAVFQGKVIANSFDRSIPKGQLWGLYMVDLEGDYARLSISGYDIGILVDFVIHHLAPEKK